MSAAPTLQLLQFDASRRRQRRDTPPDAAGIEAVSWLFVNRRNAYDLITKIAIDIISDVERAPDGTDVARLARRLGSKHDAESQEASQCP